MIKTLGKPWKEIGELKRKEWIGDAIIEFFARDIFNSCWNNKIHATQQRQKSVKLVTNDELGRIGKLIGLEPIPNPPDGFILHMNYANAVEIKVYEVYEKEGIEEARKWFVDNIVKNFKP